MHETFNQHQTQCKNIKKVNCTKFFKNERFKNLVFRIYDQIKFLYNCMIDSAQHYMHWNK